MATGVGEDSLNGGHPVDSNRFMNFFTAKYPKYAKNWNCEDVSRILFR